jgi:hypothetical protein
MTKISTDKAYIIGLIVGGGRIDGDILQITLPYKKWGSLDVEPDRAGSIARDILTRINPLLSATYGMEASYLIANDWKIRCTRITQELKIDIERLKLPQSGEMRINAHLKGLIPELTSNEHKKRFIAGLVDTVGSLADSHRRFNDSFQTISLEFKGSNFDLVAGVSDLLYDLNCPPDQILWNHPNQHSGTCRYYKSWKKGFKIRVSLVDYIINGTFVFQSKQMSATKNSKKHKSGPKDRAVNDLGRTTLHTDQNSNWLPDHVRGGFYIHNLHFNYVLGMNGNTNTKIINCINHFEKYFCPFTCLTKGEAVEINETVSQEEYLHRTILRPKTITVRELLSYEETEKNLLFGKGENDGFPLSHIMQGVAYVIAAQQGKTNGKRVKGRYRKLLDDNKGVYIELGIPDRGTCLRVNAGDYSAIIGYVNNAFNKMLVSKIDGFKLFIREPIFEECVEL